MERVVVWLAVASMVVPTLLFGLAHADLFTILIVGAALYGLWRRFDRG